MGNSNPICTTASIPSTFCISIVSHTHAFAHTRTHSHDRYIIYVQFDIRVSYGYIRLSFRGIIIPSCSPVRSLRLDYIVIETIIVRFETNKLIRCENIFKIIKMYQLPTMRVVSGLFCNLRIIQCGNVGGISIFIYFFYLNGR